MTTRRPCVSGARREAGHSLCRQPPPPPPAASGRSRGGSERGSLAPPSRHGCQRLPGLAGHQRMEGKSRFSGAEHAQVWVEGWTGKRAGGWVDRQRDRRTEGGSLSVWGFTEKPSVRGGRPESQVAGTPEEAVGVPSLGVCVQGPASPPYGWDHAAGRPRPSHPWGPTPHSTHLHGRSGGGFV